MLGPTLLQAFQDVEEKLKWHWEPEPWPWRFSG